MILTEYAGTAKETEMDAVEVTKLVESAVRKARMPELARSEAEDVLESVSLPEAAKKRVIREALAGTLPEKDGALDVTKFRESVTAAAKELGEFLGTVAPHGVTGMGQAQVVQIDAKEAERRTAEEKQLGERASRVGKLFGLTENGTKRFSSRFQEAVNA